MDTLGIKMVSCALLLNIELNFPDDLEPISRIFPLKHKLWSNYWENDAASHHT
jgi:hypothetical protein